MGERLNLVGLKPDGRVMQRVAAAGLTALLMSCGGPVHQPTLESEIYSPASASYMFNAGYDDVSSVFIEDVTARQLAMAAIENVDDADTTVDISESSGVYTVRASGLETGSYPLPGHDNDSQAWAELTAKVVDSARKGAGPLSQANSEALYEYVFEGMLAELDGYSRYSGREEARENRASRDGFGGIGVRIRLEDAGIHIVEVMESTPAELSGLQNDDVITKIEDAAVAGMDQREAIRRLRGPINSTVNLTVRRGTRSLEISVTRAHIVPQTVRFERHDGIAYLKVTGFNQSTTHTLREKIRDARREMGDAMRGYVLDLRDNPGGLLDQAVTVADLFMDGGNIVSTHGRHPDSEQHFNSRSADVSGGMPMVVLVNGNSASASEIVAAALQDSGRAIVVGSNSYGKGTVQTVLRLPNDGELTLTWARFHAPSGYALQDRGVLPDVCTSQALQTSGPALLPGAHLISKSARQREVDLRDTDALEALRALCPTHDGDSAIDIQVAEQILSDPSLYARAMSGPDTARLTSL
jgi:carboxyl-terminal processing protease